MITDDEARQNISANVRALLYERKWKQADLCRAIGEKPMRVNYLIRGKKLPSAAFLSRVAEALDTTLDELLRQPEKSASSH